MCPEVSSILDDTWARFRAHSRAARPAASRLSDNAWTTVHAFLFSVIGAVLASAPAVAGGLVIHNGSPKAIGRAGASTVGDDGAGALLGNPAAIARRDGARAQLGFVFVDDELSWRSSTVGAPTARDQAPSSTAPYGAAFGSIAGWVIGVGAMTSSVSDRSWRPPGDVDDPAAIGVAFDYRYVGIAGSARRDTLTIGAARRFGDSIALGVALGASRVTLAEVRRVWAGFSGRDVVGSALQDVELGFSGSDWFAPSAVAGVLVAPDHTPVEFGASVGWAASAHIRADDVSATGTSGGPSIVNASNEGATLEVRQPVTVRVGGRYLRDRFVVELGGELSIVPANAAAWVVEGVRVRDSTGVEVPLSGVPSRVSMRTHGAIRGAVDAELAAGFLWATVGYAYSIASVEDRKQSPTFGDLGGHTLGLGVEATAGGFTITLGWSRTWATTRTVATLQQLDNPFRAGDRTVPRGTYDGSVDQIGILVDAELGAGRR